MLSGNDRDILFTGDAAKNRVERLTRTADMTYDASVTAASIESMWTAPSAYHAPARCWCRGMICRWCWRMGKRCSSANVRRRSSPDSRTRWKRSRGSSWCCRGASREAPFPKSTRVAQHSRQFHQANGLDIVCQRHTLLPGIGRMQGVCRPILLLHTKFYLVM